MLADNKMLNTNVLAANKVGNVGTYDRSKHMKPKTGKSKSQKLAKS